MKLPNWLFAAGFLGAAAGSSVGQTEPANPAPPVAETATAAEPAASAAPAPEAGFDAWLAQPTTAPEPPHEDVEKYLANLQQRQQDLAKVLDFLVSRKRLRKDQAAKENAAIAVPTDLTVDRWDELVRKKKEGSMSAKDFAAAVFAFAEKFRAVNLAQEKLSHTCAQLMANPDDDTPARVRRAHPVKSAPPADVPEPNLPGH